MMTLRIVVGLSLILAEPASHTFRRFLLQQLPEIRRPYRSHQLQRLRDAGAPGVLDIERGQLGDMRSLYWQTDTSISNKSWGTSTATPSNRRNSSFINSSTSSVRMGTCC
jgi:hypothetical protein